MGNKPRKDRRKTLAVKKQESSKTPIQTQTATTMTKSIEEGKDGASPEEKPKPPTEKTGTEGGVSTPPDSSAPRKEEVRIELRPSAESTKPEEPSAKKTPEPVPAKKEPSCPPPPSSSASGKSSEAIDCDVLPPEEKDDIPLPVGSGRTATPPSPKKEKGKIARFFSKMKVSWNIGAIFKNGHFSLHILGYAGTLIFGAFLLYAFGGSIVANKENQKAFEAQTELAQVKTQLEESQARVETFEELQKEVSGLKTQLAAAGDFSKEKETLLDRAEKAEGDVKILNSSLKEQEDAYNTLRQEKGAPDDSALVESLRKELDRLKAQVIAAAEKPSPVLPLPKPTEAKPGPVRGPVAEVSKPRPVRGSLSEVPKKPGPVRGPTSSN